MTASARSISVTWQHRTSEGLQNHPRAQMKKMKLETAAEGGRSYR